MALSATVYNLAIELANVDRSVYETLALRIARQPSESAEYLLMRVIAYSLEYAEGIELTQGVAAGDEPAIYIRDLTGHPLAWIDVGLPSAEHIHRGSKSAARSAIYTHRDVAQFLAQLQGKKIHQAAEIPIYALHRKFVQEVAQWIERRSELLVSVIDQELTITVGEKSLTTPINEHRI
ncbi:MAG: YaeQ family protein [Chloroflexota bacterium]